MFAGARVSTVAAFSARATMSCSTCSNVRVSSSRRSPSIEHIGAAQTCSYLVRCRQRQRQRSGDCAAPLKESAAIRRRTELETGKHYHG